MEKQNKKKNKDKDNDKEEDYETFYYQDVQVTCKPSEKEEFLRSLHRPFTI